MKKQISAIALACLAPVAVLAGADSDKPVAVGEKVPGFELLDEMGQTHALQHYLDQDKVVVLEWFNPECPAVGFYHLRSTAAVETWSRYEDTDVVWLAVNSGAPGKQGYGVEKNRAFAEKQELPYPILMDPDGTLGRRLGATVTPHVMVVDRDGTLVYRGAFDDAMAKRASTGDCGFLKQALDEVLAGEEVTRSETRAQGCSVKYGPRPGA